MWLAYCMLCGNTLSIGDGLVYLCAWSCSCSCVHIHCQGEAEFLEMMSSITLEAVITVLHTGKILFCHQNFQNLTYFCVPPVLFWLSYVTGAIFLYFVPRILLIFLLVVFSFVPHCNFSNCRDACTSVVR